MTRDLGGGRGIGKLEAPLRDGGSMEREGMVVHRPRLGKWSTSGRQLRRPARETPRRVVCVVGVGLEGSMFCL